ncbi:recombination regulator RecX [Mergibacter septicus]|uniref:Regulatory protein RecX n=1 Tax=Mergibacter septicus TaxID=221402 RepID=A0A8D4IY57_9PAST|nr:recombination regulator RecX [Mergibacter septicus]AWX13819.1 recombination regulator RecX [Mergibacter septicus]AWX15811.1 recombination regulator RecX [Mergibacter septicus]QDJ15064.1 recombination regulator RecX [Mergibacter septicus]UTU47512.1 recombination regulator RecX [Mergibacter septicus]WMR95308.1 recombination regulator RecX [Mergibacter septicus]
MSISALNYLIGLLARRDYSEYEIRYKMQAKGFSDDDIDHALLHCQQRNWQSDQRFCENYLLARAHKGYGLKRIKQELKLKGITNQTLSLVLEEQEINWQELAIACLKKKFPDYHHVNDLKIKQKIWRYMSNHGFETEDFIHLIGK